MEFIINENPNATPDECYEALMDVIGEAKTAIINNPTIHINNIVF